MKSLLFAIAAIAAQGSPTVEMPQIGSEKPHFGFQCHPANGPMVPASFRYFVFMPEGRPIGMPQQAKVMITDGDPARFTEPKFTIEGNITHIVVPLPAGFKPPVGESEPYIVAVDARSAATQNIQAKFRMIFAIISETQSNGEATTKLKPSRGTVEWLDASGNKTRTLRLECDDITGRAAKKIIPK